METVKELPRTHVNLQIEIERIFGSTTFARPLFYSYPGGLRFELSESGGVIDQFLTAHRKAARICNDIFRGEDELVVCLRAYSDGNHFIHRPVLRALRSAGVPIPSTRSIWRDDIAADEWYSEDQPEYWINLAFKLPISHLDTLLWGALAKDLAPIQPQFNCLLYLFNLPQDVMVFPYDDRGMDVVGPNETLLRQLYCQHQKYLLDYDRAEMDSTFAAAAPSPPSGPSGKKRFK
nr:DUF3885 domain-containing protein [Pseudomonas bijieensis]